MHYAVGHCSHGQIRPARQWPRRRTPRHAALSGGGGGAAKQRRAGFMRPAIASLSPRLPASPDLLPAPAKQHRQPHLTDCPLARSKTALRASDALVRGARHVNAGRWAQGNAAGRPNTACRQARCWPPQRASWAWKSQKEAHPEDPPAFWPWSSRPTPPSPAARGPSAPVAARDPAPRRRPIPPPPRRRLAGSHGQAGEGAGAADAV